MVTLNLPKCSYLQGFRRGYALLVFQKRRNPIFKEIKLKVTFFMSLNKLRMLIDLCKL